MKTSTVRLFNRSGLHARPAARFVQTASMFRSRIEVCKSDRCVSAKNILQVLTLGVDFGDVILLKIDGEDEELAHDTLLNLLTKILPEEDK